MPDKDQDNKSAKKSSLLEKIRKNLPDLQHDGTTIDEDSFVSDVQAAMMLQSPRGGRLILYVICAVVFLALVWSWLARIDDVVKGQGQVVPSTHVQEIQNLEGGVLEAILVSEGQKVREGERLISLDKVQFGADLEKNAQEVADYAVALERLKAEASGDALIFSMEIARQYPEIIAQQRALYDSRMTNLNNQLNVLELAKKEKEQQLEQLAKKLESAEERLQLAILEQRKVEPLLATGAVSEIEVIQIKQRVSDARAAVNESKFAIPELKSSISEAQKRIDQARSDFRAGVQKEINEITPRYSGLLAQQKSLTDKVERTDLRSPVHGTVKKIYVDTVGGTVRPGMTLMEIVPLDSRLIVQGKVAPKDIGFIRSGQRATVKLSAYDYSVYGGLEGTVESVSADSITDQKGRTFFVIDVAIPHAYMGQPEDNLKIIPGMQAEIDIVVVKRRILDYLLRPLIKAKYN